MKAPLLPSLPEENRPTPESGNTTTTIGALAPDAQDAEEADLSTENDIHNNGNTSTGDAITPLDFTDVFVNIASPMSVPLTGLMKGPGGLHYTRRRIAQCRGIDVNDMHPEYLRQVAAVQMVFEALSIHKRAVKQGENPPSPSFLIITSEHEEAVKLDWLFAEVLNFGWFKFQGLMLDPKGYKDTVRFRGMMRDLRERKKNKNSKPGPHLLIATAAFAASRPWSYHTTIIAYDVGLAHSAHTDDLVDLIHWRQLPFISRTGSTSENNGKVAKAFTLLDPKSHNDQRRVVKIVEEYSNAGKRKVLPSFVLEMLPKWSSQRQQQTSQAQGSRAGYSFFIG